MLSRFWKRYYAGQALQELLAQSANPDAALNTKKMGEAKGLTCTELISQMAWDYAEEMVDETRR